MSETEQRATPTVALMPALADGTNDASERVALEKLVGELSAKAGGTGLDVAAIYQDVLVREPDLTEVVTPAASSISWRHWASG